MIMTIESGGKHHRRAWRHRIHWGLPGLYVVLAATEWLPVSWWRSLATLLALIAGLTVRNWHRIELCEQCIALVPLDCSEQAQKQRWLLRLRHLSLVYMSGLLLLVLIGGPLLPDAASRSAAGALLDLAMGFLVFAQGRHNLLEPWCPWCREPDEDGFDEEPAPDPVDDDAKPVPAGSR